MPPALQRNATKRRLFGKDFDGLTRITAQTMLKDHGFARALRVRDRKRYPTDSETRNSHRDVPSLISPITECRNVATAGASAALKPWATRGPVKPIERRHLR